MLYAQSKNLLKPGTILGQSFELSRMDVVRQEPESTAETTAATDRCARDRVFLRTLISAQHHGASNMVPGPFGYGHPVLPPVYIVPDR